MRAIALTVCVAAPAQATDWEVLAHVGVGRLFGVGTDAHRLGPSFGISGGPRVHDKFSLRAYLGLDLLRLRGVGDPASGFGGVLAAGPFYHPLDPDQEFQISVGLLAGVGYSMVSLDEGPGGVDVRARRWLAGGAINAEYAVGEQVALGVGALVLPAWIDKACVHAEDGHTACTFDSDEDARVGAGHFILRLRP